MTVESGAGEADSATTYESIMVTIGNALQGVKSRIAAAATKALRDPREILLVAVSKAHPATSIREAHAAGQQHFGESYVQEALDKMARLGDIDLVWHFVGPIQSNKTKPIAERFQWVHSIDRLKIAERLSSQRTQARGPLDVCMQVNVSGEPSKSGCALVEAAALAHAIAKLPRLRLRGLMAVPEPTTDACLRRRRFEALHELLGELNRDGLEMDTLSMGMSDDFEQAISAGATMVRIGTTIFGARP